MNSEQKSTPLDQLLKTAQQNIPENSLNNAVNRVLSGYSAPGSMIASAIETDAKVCFTCKAINKKTATFCKNCGAALTAADSLKP